MLRLVLPLLVCLASALPLHSAERERMPNIVLIMADDLGTFELGCYGQKWIKTPHIDRIASEGVKFTQFYSGNAVCAPCRCNLMTGKHPGHARIRDNGDPQHPESMWSHWGWEFPGQFPLADDDVTVAELLKSKGYATAAIGKWGLGHFGTTGDPLKQGFDLFYGFNCQRHAHNHYPKFLWWNYKKEVFAGNDRTLNGETYSQDRFIEVAADFIDEHKEEPFFLYLPFAIPHLSIQVPEESLAPYLKTIPEAEYTHRGYLKHPHPRAGYAAMVTHMDAGIGQLMQQIEELGLDDDTLIIFTSDNGPTYDRLGGSDSDFFNSAGPFRGLKGSLREGGIRVPLVARWPGVIKGGQTSDHIGALWDLLPTCCEVAGVPVPEGIDGLSLLPTFKGEPDSQAIHPWLYWEFAGYGGQQTVRMGRWKGYRTGLHKAVTPIELYDLQEDIGEENNIAADHPEIVTQIEQIMRREHTPSETFRLRALDRE